MPRLDVNVFATRPVRQQALASSAVLLPHSFAEVAGLGRVGNRRRAAAAAGARAGVAVRRRRAVCGWLARLPVGVLHSCPGCALQVGQGRCRQPRAACEKRVGLPPYRLVWQRSPLRAPQVAHGSASHSRRSLIPPRRRVAPASCARPGGRQDRRACPRGCPPRTRSGPPTADTPSSQAQGGVARSRGQPWS